MANPWTLDQVDQLESDGLLSPETARIARQKIQPQMPDFSKPMTDDEEEDFVGKALEDGDADSLDAYLNHLTGQNNSPAEKGNE